MCSSLCGVLDGSRNLILLRVGRPAPRTLHDQPLRPSSFREEPGAEPSPSSRAVLPGEPEEGPTGALSCPSHSESANSHQPSLSPEWGSGDPEGGLDVRVPFPLWWASGHGEGPCRLCLVQAGDTPMLSSPVTVMLGIVEDFSQCEGQTRRETPGHREPMGRVEGLAARRSLCSLGHLLGPS